MRSEWQPDGNRLARMLSGELVNVEGRRVQRVNPDAVDLIMRGWYVLNGSTNKDDVQRSAALFEEALRIDPANGQARVGLAQALVLIYRKADVCARHWNGNGVPNPEADVSALAEL